MSIKLAIWFFFGLASALISMTAGEDFQAQMDVLKVEQEKLMKQKEELQKLTEQQNTATDSETGIEERDENAGKFKPQGTLEKITKKDGSTFYTRIVSSDDIPSSDWGPEYDMPEDRGEAEEGDVAILGNYGKQKAFTMPANKDMKEVLKEIMANDGDVRKVPGLKPWRPENDKRIENQIGWDDEESEGVGVEDEDDGTGIVARDQGGAATSLLDANHQISMLKIDLQTMKQEKMMKEKSASLQITNLNQKLQETRRVMEDLKISSKRDKDAAIDLKRRVDELEEETESSRKRLLTAEAEKTAVDERIVVLQAEKDATIENLKSGKEKAVKEAEKAREEASEINTEWMERHSIQEAAMAKVQDIVTEETKKATNAAKRMEEAEEELAEAKRQREQLKKSLAEAKEVAANAEVETAVARESAANAQIKTAAVSEALEETKQQWELTKQEFKKDHNLRLLLEEALNVVREEKQKLLEDNAEEKRKLLEDNAKEKRKLLEDNAKETEATRNALSRNGELEAELAELRLLSQQIMPILIGLIGLASVLLLFNVLRVCCCGSGNKKSEAVIDHPDVKSSKTEETPEPTSKKSKKKEKKNE